MRPLHDIDLDPARLTLAQIRKLFGGSGDSTTTSLANVRSVGWFVGPAADTEEQAMLECRDRGWVFKVPTVSANFLADTDSLDENSQPIEIEARSPFPGSLRGIRLGQPESLIIELGLKHGYALEPENQIQLDHSWKAYWRSSSDGRLTFVRLRNTRWY